MRKMVVSGLGFAALAGTTIILFSLNFSESLKHPYPLLFLAVNLTALAGLCYEIWLELKKSFPGGKPFRPEMNDIASFLSVLGGTVLTFFISVELNLGPVSAAGLIGIIASVFLPRHCVPVYCGAFVGMSCPVAFGGHLSLFAAGTIAGLLFVSSKNVLNGFGGKLGTIAFFGAVSAIFLAGKGGVPGTLPGWDVGIYIILYSMAAALATFFISVRLGKGPVFSSGLVGLAGGLLLPGIYPEFGGMLGVIVICASFAGMSSPERISTNLQMCAAGVLSGIFFIYTLAHFPGAGGKLGTIAFMSCIAVRGCIDLCVRFTGGCGFAKTGT